MSIPLPIPSSFKCQYFFLPYRVQEKIFKFEILIKVTTTFMDFKERIAQHAREFYKKPISPYELIIAQIDKVDFSLAQLFSDDTDPQVLDVNFSNTFIFAYQINPEALNRSAIPALTAEELKDMNSTEEDTD